MGAMGRGQRLVGLRPADEAGAAAGGGEGIDALGIRRGRSDRIWYLTTVKVSRGIFQGV